MVKSVDQMAKEIVNCACGNYMEALKVLVDAIHAYPQVPRSYWADVIVELNLLER